MNFSEYLDELRDAKDALEAYRAQALEYVNEAFAAIDEAEGAVQLAMQHLEDLFDSADYEEVSVENFDAPDELEFDDVEEISDDEWTDANRTWIDVVEADDDLHAIYEDITDVDKILDKISSDAMDKYGDM